MTKISNSLSLLQNFIAYNRSKRLAGPKKYSLLAVSGGMDSTAMCKLFYQAGWPFAIAHANFQLRGSESDEDEVFVRSLADRYGVPFYVKRFDTEHDANEKNISIQVAARDLRYEWFKELREQHHYSVIATAHQLNDNIETLLFNLIKGTGIHGLRGIPPRQEYIIRPLLFASRNEIEHFVQEQHLKFREDSSNASDKYTRNKIRHHIIPLLREINPSLEKTLSGKFELFGEFEKLYSDRIKRWSKQLFLPRGDDIYIPILKLKKTGEAASVLFEYLRSYAFTPSQIQDMLREVDVPKGRQFITAKARLIQDRRFFILTQLPEKDFTQKLIMPEDKEVRAGEKRLLLSECATDKLSYSKNKSANVEYVDAAHIEFPLKLRKWQPGDYFYPIGMGMKKKKLKKFLTDLKTPLPEKKKVWVLESNSRIVWVAGYRLDERFKLNNHTTVALQLEWR